MLPMEKSAIAQLSDIQELRSRVVYVEGIEIALFKLSNGEIHAIENKCPHKQGKLSEGIVCDNHVYCPLHDWKINVKDGMVQEPDVGCVRSFEVEVDKKSGNIYLINYSKK